LLQRNRAEGRRVDERGIEGIIAERIEREKNGLEQKSN